MNEQYKPTETFEPKRSVLYARVSSDDRGNNGRNLRSQLDMCREYAQEHNRRIVAELAEDDRGASGASFELPKLNQVLEMAEAGEFDVLVVREMDRMSRNLAKQLIVEQELKRHGVAVEYALADYPDTPEGRLNKHLRATIAEYEREKIAERTVRGRRNKVKSGSVLVYGRPPYGYDVIDESGKWKLIVNESEARIVRLMFDWYANGDEHGNVLSLADITRRLTEMAIPTRGDRQNLRKKRGPGEWSRVTVRNMLVNETYAGVWHYGKERKKSDGRWGRAPKSEWIAVEVPSIVSRETWKLVQGRLKQNRNRSDMRRKHQYLVGGRVTCGCCGLKMKGSASARFGDPKALTYYKCEARSAKLTKARKCNAPSYRADHVDAGVWEWVKSLLTDAGALEHGLWEVHEEREKENEPIRERLVVVDDLVGDNRAQLDRLLDLYLSGEFPKDVLTDRKSRLEKTVLALEEERAGLVAHLEARSLSVEQIETIRDFAAKIGENLEAMDGYFNGMRGLIEVLDVQVTLTVEDGEKVAYARCIFAQESWPVSTTTSRPMRPAK